MMITSKVAALVIVVFFALSSGVAARACPTCLIGFRLHNDDRDVRNNNLDQECPGFTIHSAPFGNWGVESPNNSRKDRDQFEGWKVPEGDSKKQWNTCTIRQDLFPHGNPAYYNAPEGEWTRQFSGTRHEYTNSTRGKAFGVNCEEGCAALNNDGFTLSFEWMDLYELDFPDSDDFIARLTIFALSAPLLCSYSRCGPSSGPDHPAFGSDIFSDAQVQIVSGAFQDPSAICERRPPIGE